MQIDIKKFLLDYIGSTSWAGETNHDNESVINMGKADGVLAVLEDIKSEIISELDEHRYYRKGNASAEMLHEKAGKVLQKYRCYQDYDQMTKEQFKEYWDGEQE